MHIITSRTYFRLVMFAMLIGLTLPVQAAPPEVSNVQATQRTDGSRLVDIFYDVADSDSDKLMITVMISDDDGTTYNITPQTLSGDVGVVKPGAVKQIVWDAGKDFPGVYGTQYRAAITADDENGSFIVNLPGLVAGATPLEMILIPAGTFTMGSPSNEKDRTIDEVQHQVTLTKDFYIGKYEVTQAQWQAVMGSNPSSFSGDNNPVELVSWNNCQEFITKLNQMGQGTFGLPTEAEWEYSYRAGTTTAFYWGEDTGYSQIGQYAWYSSNSSSKTHEVGQKLPNAWGMHDMIGNVNEW